MSKEAENLFDETLPARRRLRTAAAVAVAALVLLRVLAEVVPILRVPDLVLLDSWQAVRATSTPSPQVVIVAVDEKSIARFGPPAWPRSEYVPLVEKLKGAGARVIGFDFTFGALEREAPNNQLLGEAMKAAGNVVFGFEFTRTGDRSPPATPASEAIQKNALPRFESVAIPPASGLIEPEPALAASAAALGHVGTVASEDGRIRVLPLVIQHGDRGYPSLGLQVARVYTGTPLDQMAVKTGVVTMGEWTIPVSASGEVLLNWPAGGDKAFAQYSFLDVVRGDVPDEAFRGKAVLVAGTASGLDDRSFPFAVKAPGVLIYATFLDNVFRFDFVQAPLWAWVLEWGLFFAACGLGMFLLPRLSTRLLLGGVATLFVLLLGTAAFLFVQKGIWLKVFYPGLTLVVPLGVLVLLRLTASERETRDVSAEKAQSQKLLGLSFQEKGMLDMALATFAALPFTEDMKLVYVNLALDFENRGQGDKALRVYKRVFDADPSFEDVAQRVERLTPAAPGVTSQAQAGAPAEPAMSPGFATGPTLVPLGEQPTLLPGAPGTGPMSELPTGFDTDLPTGFESEQPTGFESEQPTGFVAEQPTGIASEQPTGLASEQPTGMVARQPTGMIARQPTGILPDQPTGILTDQPTGVVADQPTALVSDQPTGLIAAQPTVPGAALSGAGTAHGGPIRPGGRIGRYAIERHLGRGGMGDVYLVRDTVINRMAALKTIRVDTDLEARQLIEMRQRFYREAQTAGQLKHPNIVTIYDVAEDQGMSYIVMEFIEGRSVAQVMRAGRLTLAQIRHIVYHTGLALDYAHQNGTVHRDIKPDNIMVANKGGVVTVMDFGLARIVESTLTKTGSVMGTPAYMSPEQVNGEKVGGASDIFSLGVILYELLTGTKPFAGDSIPRMMFAIIKNDPPAPSRVNPKIDPAWDAIVAKAMAKKPEDRYPAAGQLAEAVKNAPGR